jgi:hypothetical protein
MEWGWVRGGALVAFGGSAPALGTGIASADGFGNPGIIGSVHEITLGLDATAGNAYMGCRVEADLVWEAA